LNNRSIIRFMAVHEKFPLEKEANSLIAIK